MMLNAAHGSAIWAIVRQSDFDRGYVQTELSPATQTLWQNAWAEFKAGV